MNTIKGGNYYTLAEIAEFLGKARQTVLDRANKLGIEPLRLGRLYSRYHKKDMEKIIKSYASNSNSKPTK